MPLSAVFKKMIINRHLFFNNTPKFLSFMGQVYMKLMIYSETNTK